MNNKEYIIVKLAIAKSCLKEADELAYEEGQDELCGSLVGLVVQLDELMAQVENSLNV